MSLKLLKEVETRKWQKKEPERALADNDAIYLAGLIDGEGNIDIAISHQKRKNKNYIYYRPRLRIRMSSSILKDLWDVFGGYLYQFAPRRPQHQYNYLWVIADINLLYEIITKVRPYLRVKHKQAQLILEALRTKTPQKLEKLKKEISRLNNKKLGPDPMFYPEEK